MSNYLVLEFDNWIDKEQAKSTLQMMGYETADDIVIQSTYNTPREVWEKARSDPKFLQHIRKNIALSIGKHLLKKGYISFETHRRQWEIECRGSAHFIKRIGDKDESC